MEVETHRIRIAGAVNILLPDSQVLNEISCVFVDVLTLLEHAEVAVTMPS